MKSRLTEIGVKRIAPDPRRRLEIHDELALGLMLRVTESGTKSWSVLYRVAGQGPGGARGALRRMTLGGYPLLDLRAAREQARAVIEAADHGAIPRARSGRGRNCARLARSGPLPSALSRYMRSQTRKSGRIRKRCS